MSLKIIHTMGTTSHGDLRWEHIGAGMRGVTGSEQSMLLLAHSQADLGHRVTVYVPTETGMREGVEYIDFRTGFPRFRRMDTADIAIAWLSTDPLRAAPPDCLRVHSQQINDWALNMPGYSAHVDVHVAVSRSHWQWCLQARDAPAPDAPVRYIPNMVDYGLFPRTTPKRESLRCAYASSPDRGLHWLLSVWPDLVHTVPGATLHVYYEMAKWLEAARGVSSEIGQRARYSAEAIDRLQAHGVTVRGAVSPTLLAADLLATDVLLYPCDSYSPTEGFGAAVLQACAAGAVPVITDADALGEIYGDSGAVVVPRTPGRQWVDRWLEAAIAALRDRDTLEDRRKRVQQFAQQYARPVVVEQWQAMLTEELAKKRAAHSGS